MSDLFATKPLQLVRDEMEGEHRLRRVLGTGSLTTSATGGTTASWRWRAPGKLTAADLADAREPQAECDLHGEREKE